MTTGLAFANLQSKKILSNEDLRERLMDYLKEYIRQHTARSFAVDGTFGTSAWQLSGSGPGTLQVTTQQSSGGVDGSGHILDLLPNGINNTETGQIKVFPFENSNGATYHVSYQHCVVPRGIVINPRDGLPQYSHFVDSIGRSGEVDSVSNNGNGTLTFSINSVCDGAGHSFAGRTAVVYKKVPDRGAVTAQLAIETKIVTWNGTQNRILTTGLLGQSNVSLSASDYQVVLLGPSVSKTSTVNTSGHLYIGRIVANGGTPGAGITSDQRIIDQSISTLAASLFDGGPAWADGTLNPPTNVAIQLDKFISDLNSLDPVSSGAHKIGMSLRPNWLDGTPNAASTTAASISKIITDLTSLLQSGGAGRIGIGTRASWYNGTSNFAGSLYSAVNKIITDLSSITVNGLSGADMVSCANRLPWRDGKQNPSQSIYSSFNLLISDLNAGAAGNEGASRVGAGPGALGRLPFGSVRSQLNALEAGAALVTNFRGRALSETAPNTGEIYTYLGGQWIPAPIRDLNVATDAAIAVTKLGGAPMYAGRAPLGMTLRCNEGVVRWSHNGHMPQGQLPEFVGTMTYDSMQDSENLLLQAANTGTSIQGMKYPNEESGAILPLVKRIINLTSSPITLLHSHASAALKDRFVTLNTANFIIPGYGMATVFNIGNGWRVVTN